MYIMNKEPHKEQKLVNLDADHEYHYYYGQGSGDIKLQKYQYDNITLQSMSVSKTWYVIPDDAIFTYDASDYTVPQGNYSVTSLRLVLNILINPAILSFPISTQTQTNRYTITHAGIHTVITSNYYLARCLGLSQNELITFTDSTVFQNVVNFQSHDVLYFRCKQVIDNNRNILQEIFGNDLAYSSSFSFYNGQENDKRLAPNVDNLIFRLTDLNDQDIDLEGGGDFYYCVRLRVKQKKE